MKNLIVFEGLDGSGTSTQMNYLSDKLGNMNIPFIATAEPTMHNIGLILRDILHKKTNALAETIAYLFAADRSEHLHDPVNGIIRNTQSGRLVLCDRYIFSSLAYQSIDCGYEWVLSLNRNFPLPEILIFIDTTVQECQLRLKSRKNKELFDAFSFQEKVYKNYEKSLDDFKDSGMKILRIDGARSKTDLFNSVWNFLSDLPIIRT